MQHILFIIKCASFSCGKCKTLLCPIWNVWNDPINVLYDVFLEYACVHTFDHKFCLVDAFRRCFKLVHIFAIDF